MSFVTVGAKYRHFKGNVYEVLAVAKHSENMQDFVVYRDVNAPEKTWIRPLGMWLEPAEFEGKLVARFEKIEG